MISVIVPLTPTRREFFEAFCLPSIRSSSHELIIVDREGPAPEKRNEGARRARGEFLFFLDDDTILVPQCLDKMRQEIDGVDFVYADFYGAILPGAAPRKPYLHRASTFDVAKLRENNYINTMALLRADKFPGFDESLTRYQDWDLWLTMVADGCVGRHIPEVLMMACYIDQGISSKGDRESLMEIVRRKHGINGPGSSA